MSGPLPRSLRVNELRLAQLWAVSKPAKSSGLLGFHCFTWHAIPCAQCGHPSMGIFIDVDGTDAPYRPEQGP